MRILISAHGSALNIFHRLLPALHQRQTLDRVGLYLSAGHFFNSFTTRHPQYIQPPYQLLKEWEILRDAANQPLDHAYLLAQNDLLGNPSLWSALVTDRRLMMGPHAKLRQNYQPRYRHQHMMRILQLSLQRLHQFFDQVEPQAVIGFNMATFGDYLIYLIAKQRNIHYWQLVSTKITNHIWLTDNPLHPDQKIRRLMQTTKITPEILTQAKQFTATARQTKPLYEGTIGSSGAFETLFNHLQPNVLAKAIAYEFVHRIQYPFDHQQDGGIIPWWHQIVTRPLRATVQRQLLTHQYQTPAHLSDQSYVFFPLHAEPEVALSVHGRFFQNQIEVVRNIAQCLPVTWRLVIKEHPRTLGHRTYNYYRKLLAIPNVILADPQFNTDSYIKHSQAVTVISSSVGFEAVLQQKPVVTLGNCSFNALPATMVVHNQSINQLSDDIRRAISNYRYDQAALVDYVATIIANSTPINLYSDLLAKPSRVHPSQSQYQADSSLNNFADYVTSTINTSLL